MNWFDILPVLIAGTLLLLVPGGLVSVALGLRGLVALAIAPVITVTLSAVLAVLLPYAGISWSAWAVLFGGVLAAAGVAGIRRITKQRIRFSELTAGWRPGRAAAWVAGAGLTGSVFIILQLVLAFGSPDSISQTFDNIFHLNGVRYILDSGSASSLTMTKMASGDQAPYFYPAAWHGLAAALVQLTGTALPVGVNALNMVVAAVVWPLGSMLLTRVVAGDKPVAIGGAGILSALFSAFPILLLDFGVLYPNFLSISMLPATLAAVAFLAGLEELPAFAPLARWSLPVALIPGLALAHPNGFMSLLILAVPVIVQWYACRYLGAGAAAVRIRERAFAIAALVVGAAIFVALWTFIRPPRDAAFWGPIQSPPGAVFEVAMNSPMNRPASLTVSLLMIIGLVISLRRRSRYWMIGCFAVMAVLFMVVSSFPPGTLRHAITGVWYNDSYRLAALLPLVALPFAALGLDYCVRWACEHWPSRKTRSLPSQQQSGPQLSRITGLLAATVITLAGAAAVVPPLAATIQSARQNYVERQDAPLLSTDEKAVIDQLDTLVPADAVIAVNPWTGGALAYALADRDTTAKHTLTANTHDVELLNAGLRNAAEDARVCRAAKATNVRYVLDFGTKEVHGGSHRFPGLERLQTSDSVRLVLREGSAALYELTACTD